MQNKVLFKRNLYLTSDKLGLGLDKVVFLQINNLSILKAENILFMKYI